MCTLDDILDEGSKFQYSMFISFPQFIYCSHDEVYFPKLSCLIAADGGTLHSKWAPCNGCYASHSWRHKATCDVTAALCPWLLRRCFKRGFGDHSIMMLMRFGDLSQSDCSKWVMWQVKDPQPRPGWDGCLTWEKVAFIKCVKKIK